MVSHVKTNPAQTAQYKYDALGRRIEKTVGQDMTRYVYHGARVIEERDGAGAMLGSYVYGGYLDEVLTLRRGASDYYFHSDDHWNVVALTNVSGDVVERYEYGDYGQPEFYDAAGNPLSGSTVGNPYLFTGQRYDAESGLYWYKSRYFDPETGRFTSRDPLGLWGDPLNLGNPYTYTGNSPWTWLDPYGLCGEDGEGDDFSDEWWSDFLAAYWDLTAGALWDSISDWFGTHDPPNPLPLSDLDMPDIYTRDTAPSLENLDPYLSSSVRPECKRRSRSAAGVVAVEKCSTLGRLRFFWGMGPWGDAEATEECFETWNNGIRFAKRCCGTG